MRTFSLGGDEVVDWLRTGRIEISLKKILGDKNMPDRSMRWTGV